MDEGPHIKIGRKITCPAKRSPRPAGHSHALGQTWRKADSICREHAGRESWPEVAFSSFGHTSRAAASRSKQIARQNDVTLQQLFVPNGRARVDRAQYLASSYNVSRAGRLRGWSQAHRPFSTSLRAREMRKALRALNKRRKAIAVLGGKSLGI
jgi:hypothetical protein